MTTLKNLRKSNLKKISLSNEVSEFLIRGYMNEFGGFQLQAAETQKELALTVKKCFISWTKIQEGREGLHRAGAQPSSYVSFDLGLASCLRGALAATWVTWFLVLTLHEDREPETDTERISPTTMVSKFLRTVKAILAEEPSRSQLHPGQWKPISDQRNNDTLFCFHYF